MQKSKIYAWDCVSNADNLAVSYSSTVLIEAHLLLHLDKEAVSSQQRHTNEENLSRGFHCNTTKHLRRITCAWHTKCKKTEKNKKVNCFLAFMHNDPHRFLYQWYLRGIRQHKLSSDIHTFWIGLDSFFCSEFLFMGLILILHHTVLIHGIHFDSTSHVMLTSKLLPFGCTDMKHILTHSQEHLMNIITVHYTVHYCRSIVLLCS